VTWGPEARDKAIKTEILAGFVQAWRGQQQTEASQAFEGFLISTMLVDPTLKFPRAVPGRHMGAEIHRFWHKLDNKIGMDFNS
jgi:hypothetical protein